MVVAVNEMTRYAEVGRVDDEKGERSLPTTGIEGKKIEWQKKKGEKKRNRRAEMSTPATWKTRKKTD